MTGLQLVKGTGVALAPVGRADSEASISGVFATMIDVIGTALPKQATSPALYELIAEVSVVSAVQPSTVPPKSV